MQRYGILSQAQAIDLNIAATTVVGGTTLIIPVRRVSGTLTGTGNYGVQVVDNTLSQTLNPTVTLTGNSLSVLITGTTKIGLHNLSISTGQSGRGTLRDNKTTARNRSYTNDTWFPVNMILN